ncbi:MAG TPA: hypothetical protein VFU02_05445, partial [Polyangiaceae bacterium]|nr:hypothetical protein [Polyangiaceae bacterium]
ERADLASVVIAEHANEPLADADAASGSFRTSGFGETQEARTSALPVTMLAQRSLTEPGPFGFKSLELDRHKWLYAAVALGLLLVIAAIFALGRGDRKQAPAAAAQPPDHVVEFEPPPAAEAPAPAIEVKPAEPPAIDVVRPEELDVEKQPNRAQPPRHGAPAAPPAFKPSRPDYGI